MAGMIRTMGLGVYMRGSDPSAREWLFARKVALTRNSLVRFGHTLDPILEFAVQLGQLLGYHVTATADVSTCGAGR